MDLIWTVGRVLAALEQVPGEPSDLTMLLRDPVERQALIGSEDGFDQPWSSDHHTHASCTRTDLGRFLADHVDHGRVEVWAKIVERGMNEGRFTPMILGWPEYPAARRINPAYNETAGELWRSASATPFRWGASPWLPR